MELKDAKKEKLKKRFETLVQTLLDHARERRHARRMAHGVPLFRAPAQDVLLRGGEGVGPAPVDSDDEGWSSEEDEARLVQRVGRWGCGPAASGAGAGGAVGSDSDSEVSDTHSENEAVVAEFEAS